MVTSELKSKSKDQLKSYWGVMIASIIFVNVLALTGNLLKDNVGYVFIIFISPPLGLSLTMMCLAITRREEVKFAHLICGFKNYIRVVLLNFTVTFFLCLWTLLIVPLFIKYYSYSMSVYILADDPEIDILDAITLSRKMMHGHKLDLFLFELSFLAWLLLCLVTCGVAIIYVEPYMMVARANVYQEIKREYHTVTIDEVLMSEME